MNQIQKPRARTGTSLPEFEAVLPMTRRAQVAETLRNLILSGRVAPGTQLVESKLASRFGVRASCFWVYAYPALLRYAAHSAGGYRARILPQASEIAS